MKASHELSDGKVRINVAVVHGDELRAVSAAQVAAFQFLLDDQQKLRDAILDEIFRRYPQWQEEIYACYDEDYHDEVREFMPDLTNRDDLRKLIGLSTIHMLKVAKDEMAYIGFQFGCTWEDEHGLGVLMHKARIVDIGGADTSFIGWNAERDARGEEIHAPKKPS